MKAGDRQRKAVRFGPGSGLLIGLGPVNFNSSTST